MEEQQKAAVLRDFEKMGVEAVRQWLASGDMPVGFRAHAYEWLGQKDKEEQQRKAVAEAEQIEIARSAKDANWVAARAAIAALVVSVLALVISIFSIYRQH